MSLKQYIKSKIGKSGLIEDITDERYLNQYYYDSQYVNTPIMSGKTVTTATGSTGGMHAINNIQPGTYRNISSSSTTNTFTSQNWPDLWSEKQKEALAKMEMTFDPEKKEWVMRLSIDIRLPQEVGIMAYVNNGGKSVAPMDQLIEKMKSAKKQLIEKLTSKIILAELVKPREINK